MKRLRPAGGAVLLCSADSQFATFRLLCGSAPSAAGELTLILGDAARVGMHGRKKKPRTGRGEGRDLMTSATAYVGRAGDGRMTR
jgi:hypothetical protein